jgi:hypothetical protein
MTRLTLAQSARCLETAPAGSTVYLVNFPYARRYRLAMPLAVVMLEHSLQAWADLRFPDKDFQVVGLSYLHLDGPPERLRVRMAWRRDGWLRVRILEGGEGTRYPWQLLYGERTMGRLYAYRGALKGPELVIQLSPEALERPRSLFLIYLGDRVVMRPLDRDWELARDD